MKLSDDREIELHKFVVCNTNAVEQLLHHLYGCSLPHARERPWSFWSILVPAADKYLEPVLSDAASSRLKEAA